MSETICNTAVRCGRRGNFRNNAALFRGAPLPTKDRREIREEKRDRKAVGFHVDAGQDLASAPSWPVQPPPCGVASRGLGPKSLVIGDFPSPAFLGGRLTGLPGASGSSSDGRREREAARSGAGHRPRPPNPGRWGQGGCPSAQVCAVEGPGCHTAGVSLRLLLASIFRARKVGMKAPAPHVVETEQCCCFAVWL